MKKVLTTNVPSITHIPEISSLFAILLPNKNAHEWLYTNFFSVGIYRKSTIESMNKFEDNYDNCPFIKYVDIEYHAMADYYKTNFAAFIEKEIDKDKFISATINMNYIPHYGTSSKVTHAMFIYGYERESSIIYIMDHFKTGKFTFEQCSYYELNNAFYKIKNAENIFNYSYDVRVINISEKAEYHITKDLIISLFLDYLEGTNLLIKDCYEKKVEVPENYEDVYFGLKYYNVLKEYMLMYPKVRGILTRQIHMVYSHMNVLYELAKIIKDKFNADQLYSVNDVKNKSIILVNLYLKLLLYLGTEKENSIVSRVYLLLDDIKSMERDILTKYICMLL